MSKRAYPSEITYEILKVISPMYLVIEETASRGPKRQPDVRRFVESIDNVLSQGRYSKAWKVFASQ